MGGRGLLYEQASLHGECRMRSRRHCARVGLVSLDGLANVRSNKERQGLLSMVRVRVMVACRVGSVARRSSGLRQLPCVTDYSEHFFTGKKLFSFKYRFPIFISLKSFIFFFKISYLIIIIIFNLLFILSYYIKRYKS